MSGQDPGFESPLCAGGTVVRPDDGAIDHLPSIGIAAAIGKVIAHPGMDIGWVSSAARMARSTAVWLAFAVLTTERNAA